MKITAKSVLIFILLLIETMAYAGSQSYYVTNSGAGSKNGNSIANAWSVTDFNNKANWSLTDNSGKIDPGDTVFFSGVITSQISLPEAVSGRPNSYITLDGWEGGTCNPVKNRDCSTAASVKRNESKGISNIAIRVNGNSYIAIQDFELSECDNGILAVGPNSGNKRSTHLLIRRNYIHDCYGAGIQQTTSSSAVKGIDYVTIGGADGDGNLIYDTLTFGKVGYSDNHNLGLNHTDDSIISYNEIGNSFRKASNASNNISIHTSNRILVEYNTVYWPDGQACIVFKEFGGHDKIARFNNTYGCGAQGGIAVITNRGPQEDYYIYGNNIFDSEGGIQLYRQYNDIRIWSNVIHDISNEEGIAIIKEDGADQGDVYVYNNTISRAGADGGANDAGIRVHGTNPLNVRIMNNILVDNMRNGNGNQVYVTKNCENLLTSLDYNTYSYTNGQASIYYNSGNRDLTYIRKEGLELHGDDRNPGFNSGVNNDFTLDGTNINNGYPISGCFDVPIQGKNQHICYEDAIDPDSTDWSQSPPKVGIAKQGDYGSWERGAYVYKEGHGSSVTASAPAPPSPIWIVE